MHNRNRLVEDQMDEAAVREQIVELLEQKGYVVRSTAAGSGVPRNSRLEVSKDGRSISCCVKMSDGGRIHFERQNDGTYKVLSDVEWVIHATPAPDGIAVSAFKADRVREAFDANYSVLLQRKRSHIPMWVNPAYEPGWRQTGSGFEVDALWREVISPKGPGGAAIPAPAPPGPKSDTSYPGSNSTNLVDELKAIAAARLGILPSSIEIDIRFKG
jgi:hypothetical protein